MSKPKKNINPFVASDDKSPAGDKAAGIRFKKLIENSYDGLSLLDRDFRVIYRSASAERINGWNETDRAKYTMDDLIHPDDRVRVKSMLNEVKAAPGSTKICQFRSRHFSGHYIWLEGSYTNFLNDPDIDAIVCNFRNISQQKYDEELLQQTVKELFDYQYALDESAIVAITDQKGIIKHVNDNFCKISKYKREELIGQDHRIINSGYHDKDFIRTLWGTIANGKIWKGELKNKAKDGSFYWVDTTIVPFLNEHRKPYQYVAIRSDITERKQSEERIIESERFTKTITDNLPALIAYFNSEMECLFANKPYLDWFEKQLHEILGVNKLDILGKEEFELQKQHIIGVLNGEPQRFERTFHKADGRSIDTDTQYLPDVEQGKVKGFYSLIYDVTAIKRAEQEISKKNAQIEDILDNITDGFIALDKDMCYTYANKQVGIMLGCDPVSLIGKNVWELFPESVGSPTYRAMQTALDEKIMVSNEDYSPILGLWQENRVYPSGNGISMFIRDITKRKEEEHHLKLLESVITNTTDAVLITEAVLDEPGPHVVYANEAFTKMTGYRAEEIIGKTPRLLQGPKSDMAELKKLSDCMRRKEACEITTINYKKTGEEFWSNFAVSPVIDSDGNLSHFIAIERDVTEKKNEELEQELLSEINLIFTETEELNDILNKILKRLVDFGDFVMAEAWLIGTDKNKINLGAQFPNTDKMRSFYDETTNIKSFTKGEGLPGIVWEAHATQFCDLLSEKPKFERHKEAQKAGINSLYSIPLEYNNQITGVLLLGSEKVARASVAATATFERVGFHLGAEIKRKQLEQEVKQIFEFTPDILCVVNTAGYLEKVNPAMSSILEYNEEELLGRPFLEFIHPLDKEKTFAEMENIIGGSPNYYIENRYITKSGKIKWLLWTTTAASDRGIIYCAAKDITYKKELEELLEKATTLARIGSWEVDNVNETVYWSEMTREIHEVEPDYHPDVKSVINFYKEGQNRETIVKTLENAIIDGVAGDVEVQIITAKGNTKWVRVIVEAEFADGSCKRVYGSFQDVDERMEAEIAGKQALEERNTILESIDDAFFAVDKNWIVTYWNNMAVKLLSVPRDKILNRNLWEVFADSIESDSYKMYHEAITTNRAVHFEDYYPPVHKWYEISAYPAETGLSVFFKDITGRKTTEIRLKELNEKLGKHVKELAISNAELEQFAYVASHDLQEPLRMVTSFMTQLERKYGHVVDDKGRQYIHFAVDGAKRMRQIILDLLEFSRVGRTDDDLEDVDLNKLMNEILALYRRQIEEEKAIITVENLPVLQTFKTPVRQVFQNLIGNSLKYHRAGVPPVISITCKETKTHFQFAIKDNGIGIAPEYFDKIFIIFQRLHNKDEYSGTGMGLAIAKKIIENLGGKIWVKSDEDKGSRFYFTLLKKL